MSSREKLLQVLKDELISILDRLDSPRRSLISDEIIDTDDEDKAVDIMTQMVKSVPNTEKVKVTQFGIGRGINVNIDGKTYEIDLKVPTEVPKQFEIIKKALVDYSLQNNILMKEDAKKQYVKDYGQVKKNSGSTQNAANKPAPRKKE